MPKNPTRITLNFREPKESEYTCENVRNIAGISGFNSLRIPRAAEVVESMSASVSKVRLIAARGRWNKQGQGQNGHGCETWAFAQLPQCVAKILWQPGHGFMSPYWYRKRTPSQTS